MTGLAASAQASPHRGQGAFVTLGAAAQLEGRDSTGGALTTKGVQRAVEAGWMIPGGSIFLFELGLRGVTAAASADAEVRHILGAFAGVRADLADEPGLLDLMPFVRGGLQIGIIRREDDRAGLGPYFAIGLARDLAAGIGLAATATLHSNVAPFSLAIGGAVLLTAQGF